VANPGEGLKTLTVLFDRVLVQLDDTDGERRSRAGILIPATAQLSKRLTWATVVSVGPHVRAVRPGQRVLFSAEDRFEVELDGEEYVLLRERDLHAVARDGEEPGAGMYL
jgi:chaperonin GroES